MKMSSETVRNYSEAPDPELYARSVKHVRWMLQKLWDIDEYGLENFPIEGAAILAFSHRTNLDPLVLGVSAPRAVYGYGKKQIKKIPPAARYLRRRGGIFIDRENITSEDISAGMSVLYSGNVFGIAPEGTRNHGKLIGPTKDGVGLFALKAERNDIACPVVPVAIDTEHIYRGVFRRHISIVYGEPMRIDPHRPGKPRKLMEDFNLEVHQEMQEVFDQALELREIWAPDQSIKIPHQ